MVIAQRSGFSIEAEARPGNGRIPRDYRFGLVLSRREEPS
jgi:hypothetical protein